MIKTCPKCGFQNNYQEGYEPEECKKCRIIFSKIKIRSDAEIESNNYNSESTTDKAPQISMRSYKPIELETRQLIGLFGSLLVILGISSPVAYSSVHGHISLCAESIILFLAIALLSCYLCIQRKYEALRYTSSAYTLLLISNLFFINLKYIELPEVISKDLQFNIGFGLLVISIVLLLIASFYNTSNSSK